VTAIAPARRIRSSPEKPSAIAFASVVPYRSGFSAPRPSVRCDHDDSSAR
jgi:hypothetical protein